MAPEAPAIPPVHRWTRDDLARLPDDGNRYEVLDGALLVTPQASFRHQAISRDVCFALHSYCLQHDIGSAVAPGAVVFDDSELQPDVVVIPGTIHPPDADWKHLPRPLLVVEVLSSSTRHRDIGIKRAAYLALGIPEYWVLDRRAKSATVWRGAAAEPVTELTELRWQPRSDIAPLIIPLAQIFGG